MPVKRSVSEEPWQPDAATGAASESGFSAHDDEHSDGSVFDTLSKARGGNGSMRSIQSTPRKRGNEAGLSSAVSTPKGGRGAGGQRVEAPSSTEFGPEHVAQLNLAIRDLWSSSSGLILDNYPLLAPYKVKGRIHRHFHALLNAAPGGPEGLKDFEASKKANSPAPVTPSGGGGRTPKRAKKEE